LDIIGARSKGQAAVLITLVLITLLGAVGLSTDIGVLYYNWMKLQKAADAAAIAAATQLTGDTFTDNDYVVGCGEYFACANGVVYQPSSSCSVNSPPTCSATSNHDTVSITPASDEKSVTVNISRTVPYFFLQLIGLKQGAVSVTATAGIYPTNGSCDAVPIALPCPQSVSNGIGYGGDGSMGTGDRTCGGGSGNGPYAGGDTVSLVSDWQHTTAVPGNFEALALGGNGGSVYEQNIATGYDQVITVGSSVDPLVSTEPGKDVGNTLGGFSERMSGASYQPLPSQIPTSSPQIIIAPLADFSGYKSGKSQVPVMDFVELWVTGVSSPDGQNALISAVVIGGTPSCGSPTQNSSGTTPYQAVLCPDGGCQTLPASWWPKVTGQSS
jgi:hypothetical protein